MVASRSRVEWRVCRGDVEQEFDPATYGAPADERPSQFYSHGLVLQPILAGLVSLHGFEEGVVIHRSGLDPIVAYVLTLRDIIG